MKGYLMKKDINFCKEELEALTGKIIKGDITPVFFDLVKESKYLHILKEELTGEITKETENVEVTQPLFSSFEDLFKNAKIVR